MATYSSVSIIYNPHSTGSSKRRAQELERQLSLLDTTLSVTVIATTHAGHAEELAYELATTTENALIISSSGDGGYHEVVNGVMRAAEAGHEATTGLLPGGNANDHWNSLHEGTTALLITAGKRQQIDVLHVHVKGASGSGERYAHSYAGVGLTPSVARELNKTSLNRFNEALITAKSVLTLRPIRLTIAGETRRYDSLIASNVPTMSKFFKIAPSARLSDGKFEVTSFRTRNKVRLLMSLLQAVTTGLHTAKAVERFSFTTLRPLSMQLDGEIRRLAEPATVTITIAEQQLWCVV